METTQNLPIIISEDSEGYENLLRSFGSFVFPVVPEIKGMYESMKLEKPFSDAVWGDLVNGGREAEKAYQARVEKVKDFLMVGSGLVNPMVLNHHNPLSDIRARFDKLRDQMSASTQENFRIPLEDVIDVDTTPKLSPEGKAKALELFRVYITTESELRIKQAAEAFVEAFNNLSQTLEPTHIWERYPQMTFNNTLFAAVVREEKTHANASRVSLNPALFSFLRRHNIYRNL